MRVFELYEKFQVEVGNDTSLISTKGNAAKSVTLNKELSIWYHKFKIIIKSDQFNQS